MLCHIAVCLNVFKFKAKLKHNKFGLNSSPRFRETSQPGTLKKYINGLK